MMLMARKRCRAELRPVVGTTAVLVKQGNPRLLAQPTPASIRAETPATLATMSKHVLPNGNVPLLRVPEYC
jgi:hypothetical protein